MRPGKSREQALPSSGIYEDILYVCFNVILTAALNTTAIDLLDHAADMHKNSNFLDCFPLIANWAFTCQKNSSVLTLLY